MGYQVIYYNRFKGTKPQRVQAACFSGLPYDPASMPDSIRYPAPVDSHLKEEVVLFYLDFLTKFLQKDKFAYKVCKRKGQITVVFVLETKGMTHVQALLHLTAMRYLNEFGEVVQTFWDRREKAKDDEERFALFQKIHAEFNEDKIPVYREDLDDRKMNIHGLIYDYYNKAKGIVKLEPFLKRLAKGGENTVHACFQ